jgi:hypothetical protein
MKTAERKEDKQQSISSGDANSSELAHPSAGLAPTLQEIEMRAYSIHLAHGSTYGNDLDDWLQAERELAEERRLGTKTPALVVGGLESSSTEGGIEFRGPAIFGNLTVAPDAVEGLSPEATPDPTANDHGMVRRWQLGFLTPLPEGSSPSYADLPGDSSAWTPVTAGRFGMVNLNRNFTFTMQPPNLTWLRSYVTSDRDQKEHVSLGWLGQVWVFVNGKLVTEAKNFYDPEPERRDPDGRLALENGSYDIPLQRGKNEIVIALYPTIHDNHKTPNRYGWGLEMRYEDTTGLSMPR